MIKIEKRYAHGYARPEGCTWVDAERSGDTSLDDLVYEALGDQYDVASGAALQGITINIEIESATKIRMKICAHNPIFIGQAIPHSERSEESPRGAGPWT